MAKAVCVNKDLEVHRIWILRLGKKALCGSKMQFLTQAFLKQNICICCLKMELLW